MTNIDVVILSYAHTDFLKMTTIDAVQSLVKSEDNSFINFNILVIESESNLYHYNYPGTNTIYPSEKFGYPRYMNVGLNLSKSEFICICNNDLIFQKNWATEILKPFLSYSDILNASPICSIHHPTVNIKINSGLRLGYRIREEMSGW
jgi:GT2 family glycosyltransferase